jgi:leucine dehydrogenase
MMFASEHEAICFCRDVEAELKAIIAIHNTALGPGLGGTRVFAYATEQQALEDVLDLSRAMTFKAAAADLPFGGAKAVILCDPKDPRKTPMLKAFCRFVNLFQGNFQTGEDMGTTGEDMALMRLYTQYAHHAPPHLPEYLQTSSLTARGVLNGIAACLRQAFGSSRLEGRRIAIQGMGKVGSRLARLLKKEGALLTMLIHRCNNGTVTSWIVTPFRRRKSAQWRGMCSRLARLVAS